MSLHFWFGILGSRPHHFLFNILSSLFFSSLFNHLLSSLSPPLISPAHHNLIYCLSLQITASRIWCTKIITIILRSYRNKTKKAIFSFIGKLLKISCSYFLPIYMWALGLRSQTSCSPLSCWGRNKLSNILRGPSCWFNDQIDMRQIKRKKK